MAKRIEHKKTTAPTELTGGTWKALFTDGSGNIVEIPLGDTETVFQSNGEFSAPEFLEVTHPAPSLQLSEVLDFGNISNGENIVMTTTDEVQYRNSTTYTNSPADGVVDRRGTEFRSNRPQTVAPAKGLNATHAATNSSIMVYGSVRCTYTDDNVGNTNTVFITCKTDAASPPTTAVQTSGSINVNFVVVANDVFQIDYPFCFFVKKGDNYRIDVTQDAGTVIALQHINEVPL